MSLQPGLRLGPYEIIAALGAGGMGEVYTARDTRLERIVAVKILHSQMTAGTVGRPEGLRYEVYLRLLILIDAASAM